MARLSNNKKRKIRQWLAEAGEALQSGRLPEAEQAAMRVLEIVPDQPDALNVLALIMHRLGQPATGIPLLEKALASHPDHPDTLRNLASLHAVTGNSRRALQLFQRYTELVPDDAQGWTALAGAHISLQDYAGARMAAERAVALDPDHGEALMNLAIVRRETHHPGGWEPLMAKAVACNPDHPDIRFNYGLALVEAGRMLEAAEHLRAAIRLRPDFADAWRMLVDADPPKEYNDEVRRMEALFSRPGLGDDERSTLGFALGKVWERLGDYDRAFEYYRQGNELHRKRLVYDIRDDERDLEEIVRTFTPELFATRAEDGCPDETPVFVVGMPRSGSTLIEQILSSHPEVEGVGESALFRNLVGLTVGTEDGRMDIRGLAALEAARLRELGASYVREMRKLYPEARRIVDKALPNLWMIGAIHLALPKARIIHCRRDPMDNCFSIYANRFVGVLFKFGYDLRELGEHYRLYQRMMAHWRATLSPDRFLEVDYERLVEDPERVVRRMLAFCGLEWHEDCLHFYRSRRTVRTTSVAQVRRPIYRDSVARWRRFERHLGPLKEALGANDESDRKTKVA